MKMRKLVAMLMAVMMLFCIIPFSAAAEGETYEKITNAAEFTSGQYVMVVDTGYAPGVFDAGWVTAVQPTISGNVVTDAKGGVVTLTVDGDFVTIQDANGVFFAPKGGNANGIISKEYSWNWACADGKFTFTGVDADTVTLASNADARYENKFRGYKNTTVGNEQYAETYPSKFTLYKGEGGVSGGTPITPPDTPVDPPVEPPVADTLTIKEAIALGLSHEHNVYTADKYYVTGVITEVYNTQYGNMKLTDEAGNILTIYGTYSADGELRYDAMAVKPVVGDTVTIYGVVGQYNGDPQIKNGWIVEHTAGGDAPIDPPDTPVVPPVDGMATITFDDASKRIEQDGEHQVWTENGIVVINNKGDSTSNVADYVKPARFYKNSELIVEYPGMTQIVFHCNTVAYAKTLADTIGVTAEDKSVTVVLKGEDTFSCVLAVGQVRVDSIDVYVEGGDAPITPPDTPVDPPVEPPVGDTLTIEEAIALGLSHEHNVYTADKYYVTGVITEVYNTQYGNMKLTDEAGNILTIYGTYSADGELRYDAMAVKPVAGDTVTIYGVVGQYNGVPQIKNGWIVEHTAGGDAPVDPPVLPDIPNGEIETDYPFLFGMTQYNVSEEDVYFLAGGMDGYYMATTTDPDAAIVVYLEATDGGYYFYTYDGETKLYINMVVSGTHVNGAYEATPSTVYIYAEEYGTLIATVNDAYYWFGTRNDNTYTTMGPCKIEYEGFYGEFYYYDDGGDLPVDPPVEDEIDVTIPYLFGMVQENVSWEDIYFLAGGMDGYYMATTTDEYAAIEVWLEITDGGYYLYTYDGESKLYINMVVSGTHVNGAYEAAPSTVYTYDWELWTLVAEVNGALYAFGTRADREYTTMGPVKVEYDSFFADLYYWEEDDYCDHTYEVIEEQPTCGEDGVMTYVCMLCGDSYFEVIPATGEHVYDGDTDADCNVCGAVREVIVPVGSMVVSTTEGGVGNTVSVTVSLTNNPGLVSAKVKVLYDSAVLKLVGYEAGNFTIGGYSWGDIDKANGSFVVNWCDAVNPNSTATLLATLTFEVLEGAPEGFTAITLEVDCDGDLFNSDGDTVWFDVVDGGVEIVTITYTLGDLDDNGRINNRDLGLLQQYINEWDVQVNVDACDVDGNGRVNNRDLGILQQYLNDWDVEFG